MSDTTYIVKPTNQLLTIEGTSVKIGEHTFNYDEVNVVERQQHIYVECFDNGVLEDRFLVVNK